MSSPFGQSGYFLYSNFAAFIGNDTLIDLTSGAPNSVYTDKPATHFRLAYVTISATTS